MWIESEDGRMVNLSAAKELRIFKLYRGAGVIAPGVDHPAGIGVEAVYLGEAITLVTCKSLQTAELMLELLLSSLPQMEKLTGTVTMSPEDNERWQASGRSMAVLREIMGLPVIGDGVEAAIATDEVGRVITAPPESPLDFMGVTYHE